ncbi:ankyrin repeat domain-containing protein [Gammaproteobacteria bacterium]|nr:ankyrin repeat domain-containing protein [Gammaproteobacteria bacterium]
MIEAARHVTELKRHLATGANINSKDANGRTALMCAAENGRVVVAQNLVAFGADLEAKATGVNGGKTALIFAAQMGNIAMTRYLIESGSNLEAKATIFTDEGKTALIFAAENGHVPVVQHLLEKGARLEVQATGLYCGKTALMWAAEKGHSGVLGFLVSAKAQLEAKDFGGKTALIWAAEYGHVAVVQHLLEKGARLEVQSTGIHSGKTALIWAAENGHIGVVRFLLTQGAELEAQATDIHSGKTALMFAAQNGHVAVVQHLLEKGARLEVQSTGIHGGKTALMWAAENDHETVMKILVYSGKPLSYAMRQPPNDDAIITELNKCSIKARPIFSGYLTGIIANIASLKALATGSTAVLDEAAYTKRVDLLKAGVYGVAFSENITERLSGMPVLKFNIMVSIMRAAKTAKLVYGINAHFLIRTLTLGPQHSMLQKAAKASRVKAILLGYIIGETETGILMKELQAPAIKRPRHSDAAKEFLVKKQRKF